VLCDKTVFGEERDTPEGGSQIKTFAFSLYIHKNSPCKLSESFSRAKTTWGGKTYLNEKVKPRKPLNLEPFC